MASGILMELPWQHYLTDCESSLHLKHSLPGQDGVPKHSNYRLTSMANLLGIRSHLVLWQGTERGATEAHSLPVPSTATTVQAMAPGPLAPYALPTAGITTVSSTGLGPWQTTKHAKRPDTSLTATKRRGK